MNWRRFFHRDEADEEQREELEFYVDVTAEEYVARGMDSAAARNAARRKLGNATLVREEIYRMNTLTFLEGMQRDFRHALRMIRMNLGFSMSAILSLALGIGANTAIFSLVNAVLIRPLPYHESESLVGVFNTAAIQGEVFHDMGLAPGMYAALHQNSAAFQDFGVWTPGAATVTGLGEPEQIKTVNMTQGVLPTLRTHPFLGRWFTVEEDSQGTPETVILSHSYWMRRFGGDAKILGQRVLMDFVQRQVIGVMPRTFRFLDLSPDAFLPQRFPKGHLPPEPFWHSGIARLKPGVTVELANQDAARILQNWSTTESIRAFFDQVRLEPELRPLKRDVVGDIGPALGVLMGALSLVLLLVCANVANLVLVRAEGRRQEFAIRAALGAGWGRIARELLVESVTLGLLGGLLGMALAYGAVQFLKTQDLASIPRLAEVSIDGSALAFGLACSIGVSLSFGWIAVFKCGIPGKMMHARGASMSTGQLRAQNTLVVAQVALAFVLLVASGLLIRSFVALRRVHPGFTQPEQVQTVRISIPQAQAPEPENVARMQAAIVENVSRIPGVAAVALADGLPMERDYRNGMLIAVEGKLTPGQLPPNRDVKHISPGLFAVQGTRLLAGRDFTWEDLDKRRLVAIVSESMARENWGDANAAIGKRLKQGALGDAWCEVVGVVENVHDDGPHKAAPAIVYFRTGIYDPTQPGRSAAIRRSLGLAIRSGRVGGQGFLQEVAAAIHSANPDLPLAQVRTLGDAYRRSMARTSFTLILLGLAGVMALTLAIVGVYGVLAYAVSQRRRDVSIRIALGAQAAQVKSLFVRQGVVLACTGGILGLGAALGLSRWVSSLLFGVTALDTLTYVSSGTVVFAAALIASYIPAVRAASVDPMESLRAD